MTAPPEREAPVGRPTVPSETEVAEVRARIATLEREAKSLEPDPRSARLYHELGLLWERPLGNLRAAAAAFQAAYRLAPKFVENLRSARRIFSDVGNWPMVLQLLDAELAATDGARPRTRSRPRPLSTSGWASTPMRSTAGARPLRSIAGTR